MGEYSFLPWVRQKLAKTATITSGTLRPSVALNVRFTADTAPFIETATLTVDIYGPGDVVGVNAAAILKTLPPANEQQFPPHLLAGLEFFEEDFPWRYSPTGISNNNSRLAPWCWLLVAKESEVKNVQQTSAPLPVITVLEPHKIFPDPALTPLWAWAHTQANQEVAANAIADFLETDLQQNPDLALSRILSPRYLEQNTAYRAYLVPVYELGRQAGIGNTVTLPNVNADTIAWLNGSNALISTPLDFPVYYQWEFRTGDAGDFETLARRLRPVTGTEFTGRTFDVVIPATSGDSTTTLRSVPLPTALVPINSAASSADSVIADYLYKEVNPIAASSAGGYQRPILTPPVYGRYYHANGATLTDPTSGGGTDWKDTANLDVRYRAVTGLGAKQLQDNQEEYVQRAWEQVKDVLVANTNLRGMQSGLQTTSRLRRQHLPVIGDESVGARSGQAGSTSLTTSSPVMADYGLHLAGLALKRVRHPDSALTLHEEARRSNFPLAALSPAFRRLTKPFGTYQTSQAGRPRRASLPEEAFDDRTLAGTSLGQRDMLLSRIADGTITAATAKEKFILSYQFDDVAVDLVFNLNKNATPTNYEQISLFDANGSPLAVGTPLYKAMLQAYLSFGKIAQGTPIAFQPKPPAVPKPALDLDQVKEAIVTGTDPRPVFLARANRALRLVPQYGESPATGNRSTQQRIVSGSGSEAPVFQLNEVKPVMAYPVFKDAMGDILRQQRPDLFLPGLENFPNNSVVLFESNQRFVEAYLLGLNHAMGTELLWREYPTDLRGSYFRQFWDVSEYRTLSPSSPDPAQAEEALRDVDPLAGWASTPLGENRATSGNSLYVAVRADLLRRFPNTVVCAQKAVLVDPVDEKLLPSTDPADTLFPVRRLSVGQDILIFEFALTQAQAVGNPSTAEKGYFFSFLERPGEPHFGFDEVSTFQDPEKWDDVSWQNISVAADSRNILLGDVNISSNSTEIFKSITDAAQLAYATFQQPSGAAIHASELIDQ